MAVSGVASRLTNSWALASSVSASASSVLSVGSKLTVEQQVTVADTAAKVQASWQSLVTLANQGKLDAVTLSDASPQFTLKASQFVTGTKLLNLLGDNATVSVADTAANIGGMVLGSSTPDAVNVKDTAANVAKQWMRLSAMAAQGGLTSVTLSDRKPAFTLTAAQYASSAALRAQLTTATFTVKDTAANLASQINALGNVDVQLADTVQGANANISTLGSIAAAGHLKAIKLTGSGSISLTADQAMQMGNLLGVNIEVKDTAANIEGNFTALSGLKKLTQVTLTDTARPTLTLTDAQYKSGSKLLAKISGAAVAVKFAGNFENYSIKANTDGTYSVGNSKYKGVNFFQFANYTTFADTGNAAINAMLAGGTDFWWAAGQTAKSSNTQIAPGLYALDGSSTRHDFTYSFLTSLPASDTADNHGFQAMSPTQQQAVKDALSYLGSLINVNFTEATGSDVGQADINFGTNNQSVTNSSGYANPPNGSGDHPVYLFLDNSGRNPNNDFSDGSYGWQTLIHEIGHTLGLKHPGNYNATGGGSLGPFLPKATDTRRYTVMSYNNPTDAIKVTSTPAGAGLTSYSTQYVYPQTYMMYDIAALQYLYGVGDGQGIANYQVNSFSANWSGMETLFMPSDGSVDASATQRSNIIDLRAGAFSSINVTPLSDLAAVPASLRKQVTYMGLNNVGLAYGSAISTVKGGSASDTFYDAATSGTVSIDAGAGDNDVLYLAGTAADWAKSQSNGVDVYTNSKLGRTVNTMGMNSVRYYNASTYSTTHTLQEVYA